MMKITFQGQNIEIKRFTGPTLFVSYNGKSAWFEVQNKKWVKSRGDMSDKTLQAIKRAAGEQMG